MLEFLKRIFAGSEDDSVAFSSDLREIEDRLEKMDKGTAGAARLFNRAGDLYQARGQQDDALRRYGDAIDAYLAARDFDTAMAVCRKMVRVHPDVVRARCTLAWLCLGKGFTEIAREQIVAYVATAKEAEQASLASQHLQLMARFVERSEFRAFLAEQLGELDDDEAAEEVRQTHADESMRAAGWDAVIFAALLAPDDLRRAAERGEELNVPSREGEPDSLERFLFDPEQQ